jgi:hypothetical protein
VANRFWVGGAGTAVWDTTATTNWSATTGGASGASAPTAADDVFLDANSNTPSAIQINGTVACRSLNCTGFTKTLSHAASSTLTIGDATAGASSIALKFNATMAYAPSASNQSLSFISTSATVQTIDFAAKTPANVTFSGTGSSYQLTGTMNQNSASTLTLSAGTLDTNGQTCSWGKFGTGGSSGVAKTLTLGASAITLTLTAGTVWDATVGNNLTVNAGTSSISCASNGITFSGRGTTYNNVSFSGTGSITIVGANTFNNFTRTIAAGNNGALVFQADPIINGVFTVTGSYSATNAGRLLIAPTVFQIAGTQRTVTVNGSFSFTNVDFNFINAAGTAGTWTGTSMGNGGGNSNITFDVSRTLYWSGGAAGNWTTLNRWSLSSGGASASTAPLPQDDCFIDANSGITASNNFSTGLRFMGRNIDFTGVTNAATLTYSFGGFNPGITGSLTLATGMTFKNTVNATLNFINPSSTVTITSNGCQFIATDNPTATIGISSGSGGGTVNIADDLIMSGLLQHSAGTLNTNDHVVTASGFVSNNSNTRTLNFGTSVITFTGTGLVFNCATVSGLTNNNPNCTVNITDTSATSKTIEHRTGTLGSFNVSGGTGTVIFSGGNGLTAHYTNLTLNAPGTYSFSTSASSAPVRQIDNTFTATGTPGNIITINSSTIGTQAIIAKSSGIVNADYLSLTDSNATGGATWYAGPNSTNVSNNSGWIFTAANYVLTKSLRYAIDKTPTAPTKSLKYAVQPSVALTKALKYTVYTTPAMITKSLKYTVKTTLSATKSLKYSVKTTASAVTKSLKYTVVKTPSALSKSLRYAVEPSRAATKSLIYYIADIVIKSTPLPAIIKPADISLTITKPQNSIIVQAPSSISISVIKPSTSININK